MASSFSWKIRLFFTKLLLEGRYWGYLRLVAILAIIATFTCLSGFAFENADAAAIAASWRLQQPLYHLIPAPVLAFFEFIASGRFLRYLLLPLAAFLGALLGGARYVQASYNLPRFGLGLRYLLAALFALGYPRLTIKDGKKELKPGEINLVERIGGPGYLNVRSGNAVLLERLGSPSRIVAAGSHYIYRHETVKEVASLDDQHGFIESIPATTRDGIEVRVCEVHFRYRLLPGRRFGHQPRSTPDNPYPFSIQAVWNMAYKRSVGRDGITPWHVAVQQAIDSVITDYVRQHQFDYLTSPRKQEDPRADIARQLKNEKSRDRLRGLGAELLWFDIGRFDVPEQKVKDQKIDAWQAKWIGNASVERAYGQAQRLAYQELGRAEAQAEMLISIVQALGEVDLSADPKQNLRNVILLRTAQILEALTEQKQVPPGQEQTPDQIRPGRSPQRRQP